MNHGSDDLVYYLGGEKKMTCIQTYMLVALFIFYLWCIHVEVHILFMLTKCVEH